MATHNILSGGGNPSPGGPTPPNDAAGSSASGGSPSYGGGKGGRIRVGPNPAMDMECSRFALTDLGNAERWRARYGDDFRFCGEMGWFAWDGKRWELLSEEKDKLPAQVMQSVFATIRAMRNEANLVAAAGYAVPTDLTDKQRESLHFWADEKIERARTAYLRGDEDGEREIWLDALPVLDMVIDRSKQVLWSDKIAAWAKTSEGVGKINAVANLAKSFSDIAIRPNQLDQDRMAINVLNGTLRLVRKREKRSREDIEAGKSEWHTSGWKVKLDEHRREDLLTKIAPVKYSPRVTCEVYDRFIERAQPDVAMRRFIHQWGGLSLTGDISEQKLAFFYGGGRNGKGTWVEAVAHLAGDYAGSIPIESFLENAGKRRGDQATPDIARLPGVRFLRVSEPERGASLNEGLVKMVTGGDPVDARHLNKGFFTFLPSFKMTISGNFKPKVKDTSDGIWRRMQLVPWSVKIPNEEVDTHLVDKLKAEASGILNRLIEGLLDWRENGLIEPDQVRKATRAYRESSDDLGRFLHAICVVSDDHSVRVGAKHLHELYEAWAEATGGSMWKLKGFKGAMEDKGFEQKQSDGMKWLGVQPKPGVTLDGVKSGQWPDADLTGGQSTDMPDGFDDEVPPGF